MGSGRWIKAGLVYCAIIGFFLIQIISIPWQVFSELGQNISGLWRGLKGIFRRN